MNFDLEEAIGHSRRMGAPADQQAVISLLREVQKAFGGSIPSAAVETIAEKLGAKPGLLLALIRRIPSLRLGEGHLLEICAGPNCGKHPQVLAAAERIVKGRKDVTLKTIPCQRLCGKGPNIRFDGKLYHKADEALLRQLLNE
mgnify:CR=1 FL=1